MKRILFRLGVSSALFALAGCYASPTREPSPSDASRDCEGCEYFVRGLERPNRLEIAAGYLYIEDFLAERLVRVPLAGGALETVSEGGAPLMFAVTQTHLYFTVPDPVDDSARNVYRVEHESGASEHVARFEDTDAIAIGLLDDAVVLKGRSGSGSGTLSKLEPSGEAEVLREWPPSESPLTPCVRVLASGELVWCDPEDGLWSAPSVTADGVHEPTGWRAGELDLTPAGLVVASAPAGEHSIYLRNDGKLVKIATSSQPIASPRYPVGAGVVWIEGNVRHTGVDGQTRVIADSRGVLSIPPEGLAVSDEHVYFTGHRGAEAWSVYRVAAPF